MRFLKRCGHGLLFSAAHIAGSASALHDSSPTHHAEKKERGLVALSPLSRALKTSDRERERGRERDRGIERERETERQTDRQIQRETEGRGLNLIVRKMYKGLPLNSALKTNAIGQTTRPDA